MKVRTLFEDRFYSQQLYLLTLNKDPGFSSELKRKTIEKRSKDEKLIPLYCFNDSRYITLIYKYDTENKKTKFLILQRYDRRNLDLEDTLFCREDIENLFKFHSYIDILGKMNILSYFSGKNNF